MQAGKLRHVIEIQEPGGSRDAVGERNTTWTTRARLFASVQPISAREQYLAAQAQASTTHRVTIRASDAPPGINASWRLLFGGRVLLIDGPPRNVDERDIVVELLCTEGPRQE